MSLSPSSSTSSFNLQAGAQPTLSPPQQPANPNDRRTGIEPPRIKQKQRQVGPEPDDHNTQPKNELPLRHRSLLDSLDYLLREVKPPLAKKLPHILSLCDSLKNNEYELADLLRKHGRHPSVDNLKRMLVAFADHLSTALNSSDATTHLATLEHSHIQTICLGLSVCVPSYGTRLFDQTLDNDDRDTLQSLTDTLLQQAMDKGLPDGVEANGQVFDILNLVSRLLKAELITVDDVISECFGKVLVLIYDWTGGDQCQRLVSDHNLGRCAVLVATIINFELLDLDEPIATTSSMEQPATQGQLLQQAVLNLCSDAVLSRLATAPVDAVSLLNVSNTVKDALDKRVLHPNSPTLLSALDRLTNIIAKLPQPVLAGEFYDHITLAGFCNFLRKIGEYRIKRKQVFKDVLSAMAPACSHLIGCVAHPDFDGKHVDGQALTNLISFVKYYDKQRPEKSDPASTASSSSSSSSAPSMIAIAGKAASPDRSALTAIAEVLVSALIVKGVACVNHPKSRGGAVAGLAYLWASNLVPRWSELKSFMHDLLALVAPTPGSHWPYDARVILPAMKLMLDSGMVAAKDLWLPAQEIDRRIGELGAIVDTIEPLPPMPLPAAHASTTAPGSKAAAKPPSNPPGMTAVVETPLLGKFTAPSVSAVPANKVGSTKLMDRTPKKTFKSRQAATDIVHSTPVLIGKGPKKKQEADKSAITMAGNTAQDKRAQASENKKTNPPKQKSLPAQPAKSKRRPDSRSALDPVQRTLCTAIVSGDAKQVAALLNAGGEWTKDRTVAVLDQLQDELLMVGKNEISALELFLTTIQRLLPQDGAKILTTYYAEHMPSSGGVLSLLEKHDLSFDFQRLESPAKLMEFVSTASDKKLNAFMKLERSRELIVREDANGRHLMTAAILENNMPVLDKLLRTPLGLWMTTQLDRAGNSPLLVALGFEKVEAAEKLLKLSSANDQAMMVTKDGLNPLIVAIKIRALDIIKSLLALPSRNQQATVQTNPTGYNALMQAAVSDQMEVIEMLLQLASADEQLLATTKTGKSVVGIAIEKNRTDMVDKLLAHASAPRQIAITKLGDLSSVLIYALLYEKRWIAELLLSSPTADDQVRAALGHGHNPLSLALEHELVDIATRLLALKSANDQALLINNPQSISPLFIAAHRGYLTVVRLLIGLPSAISQSLATSKQGWIPLTAASQGGHVDIVRELLKLPTVEKQIKVAATDGYTALDHAVVEGHLEIVELLKQAEAPAKRSTA